MSEERAIELQRDIGKLWGVVRDLRTTLIGIDGTNGLRSKVVALEGRIGECDELIDMLREKLRHYLDAERRETCYGLAELKVRDAAEEADIEEEADVQVARIQAGSGAAIGKWQVAGLILSAIINLVGLIGVALITRGGR